MKKKLETFFDNQIEEHKNVLELCEKKLKKSAEGMMPERFNYIPQTVVLLMF